MKLYSVTDGYIHYLQSAHPHVYSNKENNRSNMRKYIGVVVTVNNLNYYVPLSSPKDRDYEIKNGIKTIRKDAFTVFRIKSKNSDSTYELKGTIQFANMIPVPESELILYDLDNEPDTNYKNLVLEELEYIRKNSDKIIKRANLIYSNKISGRTDSVYSYCLDYLDMEGMCTRWMDLVS